MLRDFIVRSSPLLHWLSLRVRLLCVGVLLFGSFLPPYIPRAAFALEDVEVGAPQFLLVEDGFLMKSSSLTRQGSRRAYAEGIIHTVRDGDNVEHIAQRYGVKAETIRWANNLEENSPIRPGDELVVLPVDGVVHTVRRGQTLSRIAELYSVPAEEIARQNNVDGDFILAGEELIIPGGKPIIAKQNEVAVAQAQADERPTREEREKAVELQKAGVNASPTQGVLQMPCNNCFFTQYYHVGHYAVDIQTKGGGPIFAAEDGVVIRADTGWNGGYGNVVEIEHGNNLITVYGHNKELYVTVGEKVKRGQLISWMGNTGRVYGQTGIHVHFEVRVSGVKRNPLLYLQ